MQKRTLSGLTSTLLLASLSLVPASRAEQTQQPSVATAVSPAIAAPQPDATAAAETLKVGSSQASRVLTPPDDVVAKVQPHQYQGRSAATLYVKNLPILTFVAPQRSAVTAAASDSKLPTPDQAVDPLNAKQDPLWRATSIAAIINQLSQSGLQGDAIQVRWDERQAAPVITSGDRDLLKVDPSVIVRGARTPRQATLIAANRLRQALGASALNALPDLVGGEIAAALQQVVSSTVGMASWYGPGFHGRRTANGEVFNQYTLTAAHRTLPFGTLVRVTNLRSGSNVVVRINDRGPFHGNRLIDLSKGAAEVIGLRASGVGQVRIDVLDSVRQTAQR
ncbi:septal ring lytic transglycosylase RlpA family protein [Synechococcus elongatus]|uniref:septal ring lytic transglycosylase RlpA family protein n=1 Tax=Synechococcus elongatus TaxID=32046 RepID=UPI0030D2CEA3